MPAKRSRVSHVLPAACLAAATLVLACCAGAPPRPDAGGSTSSQRTRHIALSLGQTSTGATPLEQPLPIYPAVLRARHPPPREIEARLRVDEQGKVSEVRIRDEAQADPQQREFIGAVREAALRWTFVPWQARLWAADANGDAHSVGDQAQPFEVGYVFRFAMIGDAPVVEVHATTP